VPNNKSHLPRERIIFPLDVPSANEAKKFIQLLKNSIGIFKVGLELFVREGPKILEVIVQETHAKIFLDLKFHDIPETVRRAQRAANLHGVDFITVHCEEGSKLLKEVVDSSKNKTSVLGITVLTSLSKKDLINSGIRKELQSPLKLALHRAETAKISGCDGVVCSGREVKAIKEKFGNDFIVVVPGVRPSWSKVSGDDQSRITTPHEAITDGADYLVIGRPIRDADDPKEAAKKIADEIADALN
jgi:orotidine-5'-phosphate decarboxylase